MSKFTFKDFQKEYPDDAACLDKVMEMRYGGTEIECPSCREKSKFHRMSKRRGYSCQRCGHHIFPCAGTVFEKSRTPLTSWFFAMYLMTTTRHGVAAKELERQLGVTYKTAWRMGHELRKLMSNADHNVPLNGHVEVDEAYIGGRRTGRPGRGAKGKTAVLGMVERDGNVRANPVPDTTMHTVQNSIVQNVEKGSRISSDEYASYQHLGKIGYDHHTISHGKKEYARGDVHTNSIEGYWSRLKNSIRGTHIHVSPKHLWKYTAEFSFRYNMRSRPGEMFGKLISSV